MRDSRVNEGDVIVVWFSCGAASAVALAKTLEVYGGDCQVVAVNSFLVQEHPDNRRFLRDVESWLGVRVEVISGRDYPSGDCEEVWAGEGYISGRFYAPCTEFLKKRPRMEWESVNRSDWMVLGFNAAEKSRRDRFLETERTNLLTPLIDSGLTKEDCWSILASEGVEVPAMYRMGFANANCIGCVRATSPTYWNQVRRLFPLEFEARARVSRSMGVRLVRYKGKRIFLDELPATAKGYRMKGMPGDCGLFCEER